MVDFNLLPEPTFVHRKRKSKYRIVGVYLMSVHTQRPLEDDDAVYWTTNPATNQHGWVDTPREVRFSGFTHASVVHVQTANPVADPTWWVIYTDETNAFWARPATEFFDGRYDTKL